MQSSMQYDTIIVLKVSLNIYFVNIKIAGNWTKFCFDSLLCIDLDKCDSKNLQPKSIIEVLLWTNLEVGVYISYKLIVFNNHYYIYWLEFYTIVKNLPLIFSIVTHFVVSF